MKAIYVIPILLNVEVFFNLVQNAQVIYQFKNIIYDGNKTVSVANYTLAQKTDEFCKIEPYVKVLRLKNYLPVYVTYNLCTGLCYTMQVPHFRISLNNNQTENNCASCSPDFSRVSRKPIYMLCKKKSKYRVMQKNINVIRSCTCSKHSCVGPNVSN